MITTAPVIVVPPPNPDEAMPQTPADILKAIGEALSCGAENFENLTQAERARCRREPWIARKLPNGTIVLEAASPSRLSRRRRSPNCPAPTRMRHQMQTAPPCPIMLNIALPQQYAHGTVGIPTN